MIQNGRPNGDAVTHDALRSIYLFEDFEDDALDRIRCATSVSSLDAGARLFSVGEPAHHVHYLHDGELKLYRTSPAGDEKVLALVRPQQIFAEAIMFMDSATGYPASADALTPSVVWSFDSATVTEITRSSTDMCFRIMARLSTQLHGMVNEIDRLTLHTGTFRLVNFLLKELPQDVVRSPDIQLTTSKQVIASRLSIKPETLSRLLHALADKALVEVHGAHIVLRNVDGLRALMDE